MADISSVGQEDPEIIRVAKLVLILADKKTDIDDKFCSVKLAEKFGFISHQDAAYLWAYLDILEDFL